MIDEAMCLALQVTSVVLGIQGCILEGLHIAEVAKQHHALIDMYPVAMGFITTSDQCYVGHLDCNLEGFHIAETPK